MKRTTTTSFLSISLYIQRFFSLALLISLFSLFAVSAFAQPPNDDCSGAISLTQNATCSFQNFDTANATESLTGCSSLGAVEDIWFSFTATTTNPTIDVLGSTNFDAVVEVYEGPNCNALTSIGCIDGAFSGGLESAAITGLTIGTTYYIRVFDWFGSPLSTTFDICVYGVAGGNVCALGSNDDCTGPSPLFPSTGAGTSCMSSCNDGATPGPNFVPPAGCFDFPNETVWFSVTTDGTAAVMNIDITSFDLTQPQVAIFQTIDCSTYTQLFCNTGSAGAVSITNANIATNATYVIAVSDLAGLSGNFDICVETDVDNSACNMSDVLEVVSTSMGSPLSGPFLPGEQVSFCYSINGYENGGCNYLAGISPSFGDCWDPSSFNAQGMPNNITTPLATQGIYDDIFGSCFGQPVGSWDWYPSGITYNLTNTNLGLNPGDDVGSGWYFTTSYDPITALCNFPPASPNDSYGDDNYPNCDEGIGLSWQVCFTLTTRPANACTGLTDCTIEFNTFADGEIGVWTSIGCLADGTTTLNSSLNCCVPPDMSIVNNNPTICAGQAVNIDVSSSDPAATFDWVNNSNSTSGTVATNPGTISQVLATPGNYSYTITPSTACDGTPQMVNVTVAPPVVINSILQNPNPVCDGQPAALTASASGGNGSYTYMWDDGTTTPTNTVTPPFQASYSVTVSDGNCSDIETYTIITAPAPTATISDDATICNGDNTSLTFNFTGTGPWNVVYSGGSFTTNNNPHTENVAPNTTTSYTITSVSDASGCPGTVNGSATVTVNTAPTAILSGDASICNGDNTNLTFNFTGTGPWNVVYSGGSFTTNNNPHTENVAPNTTTSYTITSVADAGGCPGTVNGSATVTINTAPTAILSGDASICNGDNTNLTFNFTGTGPWNVVYSGGSFTTNNNPHTENVAPNTTTSYTITSVSDAGGCPGTVNGSATVTINTAPTAILSGDASICNGDNTNLTFNFTGTGPWNVVYSGGSFTTNNNPHTENVAPNTTTSYTITSVADAGGCPGTVNGSATVTINTAPTAILNGDASICNGDNTNLTFNFTGTGPWNVVYSGGSFTTNNNPHTENVAPNTTTSYTITSVSDAGGCPGTVNGSATVTVNTAPTAILSGDASICNGDNTNLTFNFTGTGPWNVVYSGGSFTTNNNPHTENVAPNTTTSYTITSVADAGGCPGTVNGSATVTVNTAPTAILSGDASICNGDNTNLTFNFTGTGPWDVVYSGGSFTTNNNPHTENVAPNTTTSYTITSVSDAGGCPGTVNGSATVTINTAPTAILSGDASICNGDNTNLTFNFTGTGPWNVVYSGGSFTTNNNPHTENVAPNTTTSYTITSVSDAGGCPGTVNGSATVTINTAPTAILSGDASICNGDNTNLTFNFTGTGPWNVVYSGGSFTTNNNPHTENVAPNTTTSYTITSVSDAGGCPGTVNGSATVTISPAPTAMIGGDATICNGDNTDLIFDFTGTGPWNVVYSGGSFTTSNNPHFETIAPTGTTSYTITSITDAGGCTGTFNGSATVTVNPAPTATLSGDATICDGDNTNLTFNFTGTGPWDVVYSGGSFTTNNNPHTENVAPNTTTSYTITSVSDAGGCPGTVNGSATVTVESIPTASDQSMMACPDPATGNATFDLTSIESSVGTGTLTWFDAGGSPISPTNAYIISTSTTVTAVVSNNGCDSPPATITLTVLPSPSANTAALEACDEGGGQATFDLTSVNGTVGSAPIMWYSNANGTSPIANPTNFTTASTTVYATTTNADNCESIPAVVTITVNDLPNATGTSLDQCDEGGGQATFDLTSVNGAIGSGNNVTWYSDAAGIMPIADPANYVSTSGNVFAIVDANGCTSAAVAVNLTVTPIATPTVLCGTTTPTSVTFNWLNVGVSEYFISVSINGGTATTQTLSTTTYTESGLTAGDMVTITVIALGTAPCADSPSSMITCTASDCPSLATSIDNVAAQYCITDSSITLEGTPIDGVFSGDGVTNGLFNPADVVGTTATITYTYIDPNNACEYQAVATTAIQQPLPAPSISCGTSTENSVTFNWGDVGASTYEVSININGVGAGPAFNVNGTTYTETGLEPEDEVTITVTSIGSPPCNTGGTATFSCIASGCPAIVPTIDNILAGYCSDDAAFDIIATPSGGTFSGDGVVGNQFDPSQVTSSPTTITYNYIDPITNCPYTAMTTTEVFPFTPTPIVSCGTITTNSIEFNWTDVGAAEYDVTITITDGGTINFLTSSNTHTEINLDPDDEVTITVFALGTPPCGNSETSQTTCSTLPCPTITPSITNVNAEYCSDDAPFALAANPTGGTFTINGITVSDFNPADYNGQVTIVYAYFDAASTCEYSTSTITNVTPALTIPVVTCTGSTINSVSFEWTTGGATNFECSISINGGAPIIQAVTGNTWTETGLNTGDEVCIIITAIGNAPCGNTLSEEVCCSAEDCPTITPSITNVNAEYCSNEAAFALAANPTGGTFTINGITVSDFNPADYNGQVTIVYAYIDAASTCEYSTSTITNVTPALTIPVVTCTGSTINSVSFEWTTGGATNFECSISINGGAPIIQAVTGNTWTETGLNTGDEVCIIITAIGNAPCGNTLSEEVCCSAEDCPTITPSITNVNAEYCSNEAAFALAANPTGGTFTINGITVSDFNPADYNGQVTIVYAYFDAASTCEYSTSTITNVTPALTIPVVTCTGSTINSVSFEWTTGGATNFECSISINGGAPIIQAVTGNTWTETGLNTGDEVCIIITAIGNAPCGNTLSEEVCCSAEDCPTITPSITNVNAEYCSNDAPFALAATPAGGTFTINGITVSDFNPADYNGQVTIVYAYIDAASTCEYSTSTITNVTPALTIPVVTCTGSTINSVSFEWTTGGATNFECSISINGGAPIIQAVTGNTWTETGLNTGDEVCIIITAIGNAPCGNTLSEEVCCSAEDCPTITPSITNVNAEYCSNEAAFALAANPTGGTFTINGITVSDFNPADYNGMVTIIYEYIDPATDCIYNTQISTNVVLPLETPVVLCGNITTSSVEFTWTDLGVSQYDITYTINGGAPILDVSNTNSYTVTGLSVNDEVCIEIVAVGNAPCGNSEVGMACCTAENCPTITPTIDNVNVEYCANETAFALMATPAGGVFTINGIVVTEFNPADYSGMVTIIYTYIDVASGCEYNAQISTNVATPLATPMVDCGNITTEGIEFIWTNLGVAQYDITYTVNGGTQMTAISTTNSYTVTGLGVGDEVCIDVIAVGEAPCGNSQIGTNCCTADDCPPINLVINNLEDVYCAGDIPFALSGTPAGGTFSIDGVEVTDIDPSLYVDDGDIEVLYEYTDPNTNCAYNVLETVIITPPYGTPEVDCINSTQNSVTFGWTDEGSPVYIISYTINGGLAMTATTGDLTFSIDGLDINDIVEFTIIAQGVAPCPDSAPNTVSCQADDCPTTATSIDNIALEYCSDTPAFPLVGTPAGGIFSVNGTSITQFNPADYTGTVTIDYLYTDANGCPNEAQVNTTITPAVTTPNVVCSGVTENSVSFAWDAVANATGYSVSVSINGGAATVTNPYASTTWMETGLLPGDEVSITVIALGTAPCPDSAPATASCTAQDCVPPSGNININNETICAGNSAQITFTLNGTGPFNVTFTENGTPQSLISIPNGFVLDVTPNTNTTYILTTVSDEGNFNCEAATTSTVLLNVSSYTAIATTTDFNGFEVSCNGATDGSATVEPQGGNAPYTYAWSNGATTQSVTDLGAGMYNVLIIDVNGCEAEASVTLTEPVPMQLEIEAIAPLCFGDNNGSIAFDTIIGGTAPYMYSLDQSNFSSNAFFFNLNSGNYQPTVQDANGCEASINTALEEPQELIVNVGDDIELQLGDSVQLSSDVSIPVNDYVWTDSTSLDCWDCPRPIAKPNETEQFVLTVTDENGCTASDALTIIVRRDIRIYVPEAFSPNNDGVNDIFFVWAGPEIKIIRKFQIFERWGDHIFSYNDIPPNDPTYGWDGTFRGKLLNPNVFVWMVEVEYEDGRVELLKGDVTLVR